MLRCAVLIVALLAAAGAAPAQSRAAAGRDPEHRTPASAPQAHPDPEHRTPASAPQAHPDTSYSIVLTVGGGYAHYIMPYEVPIAIRREGGAASARLMWHPDHRVRFGVESGWTTFFSYALQDVETSFGTTGASLHLSAVPLLIVFSMTVAGPLHLHAGTGGYIVRSHAVSFGSTTDVTQFSQGWMAALSWTLVKWPGLRLEAEGKWYGATQFGDGVVMLQLHAGFDLLRW